MKVEWLIKELLDMPMDADVLIGEQCFEDREKIADADWDTREAQHVVDYEDGTIGIISSGERITELRK